MLRRFASSMRAKPLVSFRHDAGCFTAAVAPAPADAHRDPRRDVSTTAAMRRLMRPASIYNHSGMPDVYVSAVRHKSGATVAAKLSRIDALLRHVRPVVTVGDDMKNLVVKALQKTVADSKDFNSVESRRRLRRRLTTALKIRHVDLSVGNPLVVAILTHFEKYATAPTSEVAITAFSKELAALCPDLVPTVGKPEQQTRLTKLASNLLSRPDLPEDIRDLKEGTEEERKGAMKSILSMAESSFEKARSLIPWGGDTALSAFTENPMLLSELDCWTSHGWIEKDTKRIYYYNEDTTVPSRDILPAGKVPPEAQLVNTTLDCMGPQLPIFCGESGSGKTSLAIAMAKGLVIHLNLGMSTNISANLTKTCNEEKGTVDALGKAVANGLAGPMLRLFQYHHDAPAGGFGLDPAQELTIVLDEMGSYAKVVNVLCRCHAAARKELAKMFGLEEGRVGLIIAGTGAETGANMPGSPPGSFHLHRMPRLPDYWENHYKVLVKSPKPITRALARAARPISAMGTPRPIGPLHALVLRLCENARFAAILANVIAEHALNDLAILFSPVPERDSLDSDAEPLDDTATTSALMAAMNTAIARFVQANALQSCAPGYLRTRMAAAAELVVNGATWQRAMDHSGWRQNNVNYGVLTSGVTKVDKNTAHQRYTDKTHTIISYTKKSGVKKGAAPKQQGWMAGYDKNGVDFLALPIGKPCVLMGELAATLPFLAGGLLWVPPAGVADGFTWTVASAAALYCMMPDVNVNDTENVDATVLTPLRLLLNGLKHSEKEQLREVQRWVCPVQIDHRRMKEVLQSPPGTKPAWLTKIRNWISEDASVVVINAPMASYADVIVFAPGRLVLLQCKSFDSTPLTDEIVNEAFDKMMPAEVQVAYQFVEAGKVKPNAAASAKPPKPLHYEVCRGAAVVERTLYYTVQRRSMASSVAGTSRGDVASTVAVTFRYHVIDVTRHHERALHGLHPIAQRSWV